MSLHSVYICTSHISYLYTYISYIYIEIWISWSISRKGIVRAAENFCSLILKGNQSSNAFHSLTDQPYFQRWWLKRSPRRRCADLYLMKWLSRFRDLSVCTIYLHSENTKNISFLSEFHRSILRNWEASFRTESLAPRCWAKWSLPMSYLQPQWLSKTPWHSAADWWRKSMIRRFIQTKRHDMKNYPKPFKVPTTIWCFKKDSMKAWLGMNDTCLCLRVLNYSRLHCMESAYTCNIGNAK